MIAFARRDSGLMACANTLQVKNDFVRNNLMSLAIVPLLTYKWGFGLGRSRNVVWLGLFVLNQQGHKVEDNFKMNSSMIALLRLQCHL